MRLRHLIEKLQEHEAIVGPGAFVFCGEVQSGDRVIVSGADRIIVDHRSYTDCSDELSQIKIGMTAVEIT